MPGLAQVHIDVALTNISLMYSNEAYIAEEVLPPIPVPKRSDKYFRYKREDFTSPSQLDANGRPLSLRDVGAEAAEINYSVDTASYFAEEYSYREIVADATVAYADNPLQPDVDATIQLTERLKLDNEVAVAGLVGTRGNYPTANKVTLTTGGSGTSWASYASANSKPFMNMVNGKLAVIKGIGREANSMAIGVDAARTLADHPDVKDLVKYTHPESLTMSGLPKIVRGLTVIEGSQQKNTAKEGASYSGGNVWAADDATAMCLIYYRTTRPSLREPAFGYTFEAPDDTTGVRGYAVRRYREEKRKGWMIEASFMRDWKFVGIDGSSKALGGYLISSATA